MPEPPDDDPTLSPDALKRIGLAGRGALPRLPRFLEGLPDFLRALRPTWRGVLLTILVAWMLQWLGSSLAWSLHPLTGSAVYDDGSLTFGRMLAEEIERRARNPLPHLGWAPTACWNAGSGALAPFLAIGVAIAILRSSAGSVRRLWIGAVTAAAGAAGIVWAMFLPAETWTLGGPLVLRVPNGIVLLAGATAGAWLLYRATGLGTTVAPLRVAGPPVALAALISLNLHLGMGAPFLALRCLFHGIEPSAFWDLSGNLWKLMRYTVPVLGGILLLVPALIVARGLGFREALRLLRRIAARRPVALLAAYVGLAVLAFLPIGAAIRAALVAARVVSITPGVFPGSLLMALGTGVDTGLFVYATALAANALAEVTPAGRPARGRPA